MHVSRVLQEALGKMRLKLSGGIEIEPGGLGFPDSECRPASDETEHSGRLLLRMPRGLHGQLAQQAEREGVSLNRLIVMRLSGSLSPGASSTVAHEAGEEPAAKPRQSRLLRNALVVNFAVLLVTGVAAVTLLVTAYR